MLDRIQPSVDRLIAHVSDKTGYVEPKPTVGTGQSTPHAGDAGEHG